MRYITLDGDNRVVSIRFGESIVEGEIESEYGECRQIRQEDGSFINDPTPIPIPESEIDLLKKELNEQKLQTQLLDLKLNIISESVVV